MANTFNLKEAFAELKNCVDAHTGNDTFCTLAVEIKQHRQHMEPIITVTGYFGGGTHMTFDTFEELMEQLRYKLLPEKKPKTTDVVI